MSPRGSDFERLRRARHRPAPRRDIIEPGDGFRYSRCRRCPRGRSIIWTWIGSHLGWFHA